MLAAKTIPLQSNIGGRGSNLLPTEGHLQCERPLGPGCPHSTLSREDTQSPLSPAGRATETRDGLNQGQPGQVCARKSPAPVGEWDIAGALCRDAGTGMSPWQSHWHQAQPSLSHSRCPQHADLTAEIPDNSELMAFFITLRGSTLDGFEEETKPWLTP